MAQTKSYNRLMAGNRLYERRKQLGWSRGYVSEKVGKVEKYYADIERGYCGMSLETLIDIADCLGITLDYLVFGEAAEKDGAVSEETKSILFYLENCNEEKQKKAMELLKVYLAE